LQFGQIIVGVRPAVERNVRDIGKREAFAFVAMSTQFLL
jgi:hypothetical protein